MNTTDSVLNVKISKELAAAWFVRDHKGRPLSVDWGEPDEDGFWTPLVHVSDDGLVLVPSEFVEAARWAHDKLNDEHDTCDCTCVACCGCFTEWLGEVKNYEEWCRLGKALRDFDAGISSVGKGENAMFSQGKKE